MLKNIHRRLIKKLLIFWGILSVLISAVILFIELKRIDKYVVNLAIEESKDFISEKINYINSSDPAHHEFLRREGLDRIKNGHFIVIELYDKNKQNILTLISPQKEQVEETLHIHPEEDIFMKDVYDYKSYYLDKQFYLRIYIPLRDDKNEIAGYFEGVYQVASETISAIKERIIFSLLQVILTILATTIILYPIIIVLNNELIKFSDDLTKANIGMLKILGRAIAKRDSITSEHNYRVTIYAIHLAKAIGLGDREIQGFIKGAFLHDVGKIGISDSFLFKPNKFTNNEFEIMKTHVQHGIDIVSKYTWLKDATDIIRYHHEKYDGSGYADGLKGESIPITARIFSIADYFDALTSSRPYREPLSYEEAIQALERERGVHFDPVLLDEFIKVVEKLYHEVSSADETTLEKMLDGFIEKYFINRLNPQSSIEKEATKTAK